MSPWICVCPVCRSVGEGMAVGQDTSVCAAVSVCVCVCVCVSAIAVCPCAHRPCPLCVFAVCPYVCVSAPQTVCVSAASESSSACPAGVLATVVATSISRPSVCPPVLLGRGGAGSGGKRRGEGVSTSPPTPARVLKVSVLVQRTTPYCVSRVYHLARLHRLLDSFVLKMKAPSRAR